MLNRSSEIVRDYELLALVGAGSFASVYKAKHRLIDRVVAIKVIHPNLLEDTESLQRFKAEAKIIAELDHPHIVQLYEFWVDDRGAYIVMQWMEGKSLREYLDEHKVMSLEMIAQVLAQIAPALSLVHRKNIIHRDLKPANIMLDAQGKAHIADFGLAKWHVAASDLTHHGEIVGTPAYMPPEQAESLAELTGAADIYSLGIILFEMLTGTHPFGTAAVVPMILHHMRDALPELSKYGSQFPAGLDDVLQMATQKNPAERFQDAVDLANAFQEAVRISVASPFLAETTTLTPVVRAYGDLHARIYTRPGAILENPRSLFGRDEIVKKISAWLEQGERVLLQGLAGIGKTSIAGYVSALYLGEHQSKVIWVELGKQDANTLFEAIAYALGLQQQIASITGNERIAIMRDMLLDQDALLVIDNVWNEEAILPIMRAIPYSMPTLMTSRLALSVDGIMFSIDQLDSASALKLLAYHAGHNYDQDTGANRLCELLGNHPYALELSGKHLKVYRHLKPDKLAKDIKDAPHNLVVTGALGIEHQRSIKELLDESVNELSDDLRELLILLGGLSSSRISIELLAYVLELDESAIESTLSELERNGLLSLIPEGESYAYCRLHDLTYSYVHTVFKNLNGDTSPIILGVRHFVHERVQDYDALEFNLVNILGAARSAYHTGDNDSLIDIMRQLVVEANYLQVRGVSSAALELLQVSIRAATARQDYEAAHYFTVKLGNVYFQITAEYTRAVEAYSQSLDFARKMKNLDREASLLSFVATARFKAGMDEVEDYYEQAANVANSSGDAVVAARIFLHRSYHAQRKDPPDNEAGRYFSDQAVQLLTNHVTYNEDLIGALNNRAVFEEELGLLDTALQSYLKAYEIAQMMDDHMWLARVADNLGQLYHRLDDRIRAEQYFRHALELATQLKYDDLVSEITQFALEHDYDHFDPELNDNQ